MKCPISTQNPAVNLRNKEKAVKKAQYGPDPFGGGEGLAFKVGQAYFTKFKRILPIKFPTGNEEYWEYKSYLDDISVRRAKHKICGNCRAFNVSDQMVGCKGASREAVGVICIATNSPKWTRKIGFCEMFDFKCSAFRTCNFWIKGGPKYK